MGTEDDAVSRRSLLQGVGMAGLTALAGCATAGGDVTSLRLATFQPPVTLDPLRVRSVGSARTASLVFDGLYGYGEDVSLEPRLAAGPPTETEDGFRVELVDDATFHDGTPVTASDVVYSYETPVREHLATKPVVDLLDGVESDGDRTVRLRFDGTPMQRLDLFTHPIVPETARRRDPASFETNPVGSGPFRVQSFQPGKKAVLARREDDWLARDSPVTNATVAYVESPITQLAGLAVGRYDTVLPVSPRLTKDIPRLTGQSVETSPSYRSLYFGFNLNDGPTSHLRVRRAIAHCIDLDSAVHQFLAPLAHRQPGPLPPRVAKRWNLPQDEWRDLVPGRNLAQARRLFSAARDKGGQINILTSKDPRWKELAEHLASGIRDAGRDVLVKAESWSRYLEHAVTGAASDYSVFVGGVSGTSDPDSFLYPILHENAQGLTNGVFSIDEPLMEALSAARHTEERETRRQYYETASRRLLQNLFILPIATVEASISSAIAGPHRHPHPIPSNNPQLVTTNGGGGTDDGGESTGGDGGGSS